jgi:nuclear pore complex protein Nup210
MRVIALFPDPEQVKQGLNLLIILGAWMLWKHRNNCVFNGANPNTQFVIRTSLEETNLWCFADAKGLAHLEVVTR